MYDWLTVREIRYRFSESNNFDISYAFPFFSVLFLIFHLAHFCCSLSAHSEFARTSFFAHGTAKEWFSFFIFMFLKLFSQVRAKIQLKICDFQIMSVAIFSKCSMFVRFEAQNRVRKVFRTQRAKYREQREKKKWEAEKWTSISTALADLTCTHVWFSPIRSCQCLEKFLKTWYVNKNCSSLPLDPWKYNPIFFA